jgi:hypothetical protein
MRAAACMGLLLLATGCDALNGDDGGFPPADRPVSDIVAAQFRDEESRDRVNEADSVMEMAAIEPGMTPAGSAIAGGCSPKT